MVNWPESLGSVIAEHICLVSTSFIRFQYGHPGTELTGHCKEAAIGRRL